MLQWRHHSRELTLDEMLRLEGRGAYASSPCAECSAPCPLYRCLECFSGELFCPECIRSVHRRSPFHAVEVSIFFWSAALKLNCILALE